ncbi:HAMP domain-containing sensor histidine kinase [Ferrovibrio sp.]|uniref:sensor histidine kinase n=1 Tax=Ferrovibrio sp. TaxID=1917215 RepID=UPI00311D7116
MAQNPTTSNNAGPQNDGGTPVRAPSATAIPGMNSLSGRLLVLTIVFVMLAEVLIYLPSMARFRISYFEARIELADQAALALLAAPDGMVSAELEADLLHNVGGKLVAMKRRDSTALILSDRQELPMLGKPMELDNWMWWEAIIDAIGALTGHTDEYIRVISPSPRDISARIEVVLPAAPLTAALRDFSWRIFSLSLIISVITAGLVYLTLQWWMVRPMRRLIDSIVGFRAAPEDARQIIRPSARGDELGRAERELQAMQQDLRQALTQQTHLAQLGIAVSKISHDLRNMLASAQLVSDRLAASDDPTVRQVAPRLVGSIDRAIALCAQTLRYGKAEELEPAAQRFALRSFLDGVAAGLGLPEDGGSIRWINAVPGDLTVYADPDHLYRVLSNLTRNACHAMPAGGTLHVSAMAGGGRVVIEVADSGSGLNETAKAHLFEAFRGSRNGGTGLGLAIARELVRAHGGELELARTGPLGTTFRISLPDAAD